MGLIPKVGSLGAKGLAAGGAGSWIGGTLGSLAGPAGTVIGSIAGGTIASMIADHMTSGPPDPEKVQRVQSMMETESAKRAAEKGIPLETARQQIRSEIGAEMEKGLQKDPSLLANVAAFTVGGMAGGAIGGKLGGKIGAKFRPALPTEPALQNTPAPRPTPGQVATPGGAIDIYKDPRPNPGLASPGPMVADPPGPTVGPTSMLSTGPSHGDSALASVMPTPTVGPTSPPMVGKLRGARSADDLLRSLSGTLSDDAVEAAPIALQTRGIQVAKMAHGNPGPYMRDINDIDSILRDYIR